MCELIEKNVIYLDNNSTTPLEESVIRVIHETCRDFWANPSSSSLLGQKAKERVETARKQVARCVNAQDNNVVFVSGGTEGNNMVIESCVRFGRNTNACKPHVITSSVDHDATLEYVKHLQDENLIELTLIPMKKDGSLSSQDFLSAIKHNTCLISLMMANNETGVIFPVSELGRSLLDLNKKRNGKKLGRVFFHTDAAQTIGKVPVDIQELNVDYITVVGHKFYGPRVGAICRRDSDVPLSPLLYGGGQEWGLRPGTENTPMVAGLGEACELVSKNLMKFKTQMQQACDHLQSELKNEFGEEVIFNFNCVKRLPNTLSVSFVGVSGRDLLGMCPSVIASTGSACHASSIRLSRVLLQALDEKVALGTLRLSVGRTTSLDDIKTAVALLRSAYIKLISQ